jgi:Flp pilus assembly protein TadD
MGIAYERGIFLYRQKRFAMAADEFRRELSAEPNQARTHSMLCLSLLNSKRRDEAEFEGRRAIELDPNLAFAYYAMSFVALSSGRHPPRFGFAINRRHLQTRAKVELLRASKKFLVEAVRLDPTQPDYFGQLAAVEFDLGRFKHALAAAERGLSASPVHEQCADMRARTLDRLGRKAEALATTDRSLEHDPERSAVHSTRGWLLLRRGKVAEARQHFLEALRLAPDDKRSQRGLKTAKSAMHPIFGLPNRLLLRLPGGRGNRWVVIAIAIAIVNIFNGNADPTSRWILLAIMAAVFAVYGCIIAGKIFWQRFATRKIPSQNAQIHEH